MKAAGPIRGLLIQCRWVLRAASLIVPQQQRRAWHEDRYGHVWHWAHFLHETGRLSARTRLAVVKFAWSSFVDALWRRFDRDKVLGLAREVPRAPHFCLLVIASLLLVALAMTGFAPTIRSSLARLPYKEPDRLANFSFNSHFIHYYSDGLFDAASVWASISKTAESVSAYSWQPASLYVGKESMPVTSAHVSPDFFEVLGVNAAAGRVFHSGDEKQCSHCMILSHHLWQYGFHSDPAIVGKQVGFQDGAVTIVGVLPSRFWFISPEISVWTVSQSHALSANSVERTGAVLRLRPGVSARQAESEFSQFVQNMYVHDKDSALAYGGIDVTSLNDRVRQGTQVYLLFIMLAFLGSLALLAYRLVNSTVPSVHLSLRDKCRWWAFFAGKTVLLLALCFVVSVEGTHWVFLTPTGAITPFAGPVSAWLFLVTTVLVLTWSFHDQGRRCRLCLQRMGNEIYVGAPASLLLEWCGTELVCPYGHGMLHVPEMQTSWLEMEQWTPLDDSWKALFESENVKV